MRSDSLGLFWEDHAKVRAKKEAPPKRMPPDRTWERPDYLPGLDDALAFNVNLFTDEELIEAAWQHKLTGKPHELIYDIESYPNYFLIAFECVRTGKIVYFERGWNGNQLICDYDVAKLKWIFENFCCIGFNSISYDATIAAMAIAGKEVSDMYEATKSIIEFQERPQDVLRSYGLKKMQFDHIDLIEVAPLRASLKIYGGRTHCERMQDLPFVPGTYLSPNQIAVTRWYCLNDLASTKGLRNKLKEQIELRIRMSAEYRLDLRSKSDAQIAEAVIGHEIQAMSGHRCQRVEIAPGTSYRYNVPRELNYQTDLMKWVLDVVRNQWFTVGESGSIDLPQVLKDLKIQIGGSTYQMGIGGLHSTESQAIHIANKQFVLRDVDVESFYPRIILNQQLYPKHLGFPFLHVYKGIVDRRIAAKAAGNTVVADSLKITINGSFGKFGSKYSILYAPDLLIQTTISGQLYLLMLIERLELCGIPVVSANTDGVVIKVPTDKYELYQYVVDCWQRECGFKTEETKYSALYSRDVNNYIAVYETPKKKGDKVQYAKTKGFYGEAGLTKNPNNYICVQAVIDHLVHRKPIDVTVRQDKDIRNFIAVRSVKGGAVKVWETEYNPKASVQAKIAIAQANNFTQREDGTWWHPADVDVEGVSDFKGLDLEAAYKMSCKPTRTEYLGKSVRWYKGVGVTGEIVYALSGNKVPRSDGAKPMMQMPTTFPDDIDYDWYIAEANKMLVDLGYGQ